jgi:hypothetical protein
MRKRLLLATAVLALLIAAFVIWLRNADAALLSSLERIEPGTSRQQVEAILGQPDYWENAHICGWRGVNGDVLVDYDQHGRVGAKKFGIISHEPTSWERVRAWRPW